MSKVYLVVSVGKAPGRVYAIFHSREDAQFHLHCVDDEAEIETRTVFTGQANNPGYNR